MVRVARLLESLVVLRVGLKGIYLTPFRLYVIPERVFYILFVFDEGRRIRMKKLSKNELGGLWDIARTAQTAWGK